VSARQRFRRDFRDCELRRWLWLCDVSLPGRHGLLEDDEASVRVDGRAKTASLSAHGLAVRDGMSMRWPATQRRCHHDCDAKLPTLRESAAVSVSATQFFLAEREGDRTLSGDAGKFR
jgi:hypothetical protein